MSILKEPFRFKLPVLLALLLLYHVAQANDVSLLKFNKLGFQIQAIEGKSDAQGSMPLSLTLPATNGFSPNVTVILQPYKGTLESYKDLTEKELKQNNLTIIRSKIINGIYIFEYSGTLTGKDLHVYSRAQKKGNHVYLATATDLIIQWDNNKLKLVNAIDSFELTE